MRTKTALIADDDAPVRELLGRVLTQLGWLTVEVADGAAAVMELSRHGFDLVILDYHMPQLSGLDVLHIMRESDEFATISVVVVSGFCEADALSEILSLGISDFLVKPLRPTVVKDRLRRIEPAKTQGPQPQQHQRTSMPRNGPLLVVDTDAEYRRFVRTALMFRYDVAEAASAIDALQQAAQAPPGICILGTDVGLMKPGFLASKLRDNPAWLGMGIVGLSKYGAQAAAPPFDGILRKTFVTTEFLEQFDALFPPAFDDEQHVLGRVRRTVEGATEQSIGIMAATGLTLERAGAQATAAGHVQASIDLTLSTEHTAFRLVLRCSSEHASAIGGLMLEMPASDVSPEDGVATLGELANMVAGRVKTSLLGEAIDVTCTLPKTTAEASTDTLPATDVALAFSSGGGEFVLYVVLHVLPPPSDITAEGELQASA